MSGGEQERVVKQRRIDTNQSDEVAMAGITLVVVTGASRGIGKGIAEAILKSYDSVRLLLISRSNCDVCSTKDTQVVQKAALDLGDLAKITAEFPALLDALVGDAKIDRAILINNAGSLGETRKLSEIEDYAALDSMVRFNLTGFMALSSIFARKFNSVSGGVRLIDVNSGAGRKPFPTWSPYCSVKAARKMAMEVVAAEESENLKTLCYGPGVVATKIQDDVQGVKTPISEYLGYIIRSGQAVPVEVTAAQLVDIIAKDDYKSGEFIDIYERQPQYTPKGPDDDKKE